MEIPTVILPDPIVVPPKQQEVFDSLWITSLIVRTLPPTDQSGGGLVEIE